MVKYRSLIWNSVVEEDLNWMPMVELLEMAVVLLLKYPRNIFLSFNLKLLNRRVAATKLNGFAVATAPSVVNRTAGGLIELAKSELDEAILA